MPRCIRSPFRGILAPAAATSAPPAARTLADNRAIFLARCRARCLARLCPSPCAQQCHDRVHTVSGNARALSHSACRRRAARHRAHAARHVDATWPSARRSQAYRAFAPGTHTLPDERWPSVRRREPPPTG
eukprot:TRINITY_DN135_c0_g1_i1.p2 TRINITY_DN135_c0_g1~~TRINITY_DN135_c0_g1_i1.p2  ORF type:complete len:131 (+),score=5.75 TRINITY_DN135_c0_g1_i1:222-614(+)